MREQLKDLQMIDICEIENLFTTFFGGSDTVYGRCKASSEIATEREGLYLVHDLGPAVFGFSESSRCRHRLRRSITLRAGPPLPAPQTAKQKPRIGSDKQHTTRRKLLITFYKPTSHCQKQPITISGNDAKETCKRSSAPCRQ